MESRIFCGSKWVRGISLWNSSAWTPATWTTKRQEEVLSGYLSLKSKHISTPVGSLQLLPHVTSTWRVQARGSSKLLHPELNMEIPGPATKTVNSLQLRVSVWNQPSCAKEGMLSVTCESCFLRLQQDLALARP